MTDPTLHETPHPIDRHRGHPAVELGQGRFTSIPMLPAEGFEVDIDMRRRRELPISSDALNAA